VHVARVDHPAGRRSQDRSLVLSIHHEHLLVVADGAGGTTHGEEAASAVVVRLLHELSHGVPLDERIFVDVLRAIDSQLARERTAGETTALVVVSGPSGVRGASVGDCEAWLVGPDDVADLTASQHHKPLLGSGRAIPTTFAHRPLQPTETLLVASDGLFGYAGPDVIADAARSSSLDHAIRSLVEAARLSTGALHDDLTAILLRVGPGTARRAAEG
jgi:serine/threonine protein phosphatase PrpC